MSGNIFKLCMGNKTNLSMFNNTNKLTHNSCVEKRNVYWSEDLTSVTLIPSRRGMSNIEKDRIWYSSDQVEKFAYDEVKRRERLGVDSRQILYSEVIYTEC